MTAKKNTTTAPEVIEEQTDEPTGLTVKDVAALCDTDPKAFRRWLRTQTSDRAGRGGRWAFSPEVAAELVTKFNTKAASKAQEPTLNEDTDEG